MKILNLYACLGGNRYKWNEVKEDIEVTSIELDPELAKLYQDRFPNDTVIVADAHQYLLDHYKEFDFIWSSPPCPTHSKARFARRETTKPVFPDMKLYEEVLFLQHNFKGKYVVENVIPYYTPLIPSKKRGRHLYWTNFNLPSDVGCRKFDSKKFVTGGKDLQNWHKINLDRYKGEQRKDKIARNLVDYEVGKTIFQTALGIMKQKDTKQTELF
jgi:DNA (cytosine-5)-methyltransferase 1